MSAAEEGFNAGLLTSMAYAQASLDNSSGVDSRRYRPPFISSSGGRVNAPRVRAPPPKSRGMSRPKFFVTRDRACHAVYAVFLILACPHPSQQSRANRYRPCGGVGRGTLAG